MKLRAYLLMLFVVAVWGSTFVLVKGALADATPGAFNLVRMTLAFAVLPPRRRPSRPFIPGQSHPRLLYAIPDAVLMSAGDRYEELARRVKEGFGTFDAEGARNLMRRPVCMTSNIHCALFEPETLDFWVANADSQNPAAHTRYTHYNLAELLRAEASQ